MIEPPGLRAACVIRTRTSVGEKRVGAFTSEESARTLEGVPARTCVQARMVAEGKGTVALVSILEKEKYECNL